MGFNLLVYNIIYQVRDWCLIKALVKDLYVVWIKLKITKLKYLKIKKSIHVDTSEKRNFGDNLNEK